MNTIKGIIFDFGDVICFWETEDLGEARSLVLGLPKETIKNIIWDYLDAAHEGTYHSVEDYFEKAKSTKLVGVDIVAEVFNEMEVSASIDQRMVDLITSLKQHYKIALLSNFVKGIEDYLTDRFHIGHLFDAVISSYNIQKKKPSLDAYHYASGQLALKPEECLFVDDSGNNVLAAKKIGMQGLVFKNYDDFRKQLKIVLGEKQS